MYLNILFLTLCIYLLILLSATNYDLCYPAVIVVVVYLLTSFFAIIEKDKWNINIDGKTFLFIITGISTYCFAALITSYASSNSNALRPDFINVFEIRTSVEALFIIFDIIVAFKYIQDIQASALSISAFNNISEMIKIFRVGSTTESLETSLSSFSTRGYLIMSVIAYINAYIITQFYALKIKKGRMWNIIYWMPIVIFSICTLFSGARNPILQLVCSIITMLYVQTARLNPKKRKLRIKFAVRMVALMIVILVLFTESRKIIGRESAYGIVDYIALYVGAPIKLFDIFVKENSYGINNHNIVWGQETFVNLWKHMGRLIGDDRLSGLIMNKTWQTVNGYNIGNVYTAFREPLNDFGFLGMILLIIFHSAFFTYFYKIIKRIPKKGFFSKSGVDLRVLMFGYLSQSLFYYSIDDRFYQAYFSIATINFMIVLVFLILILSKLKVGSFKFIETSQHSLSNIALDK